MLNKLLISSMLKPIESKQFTNVVLPTYCPKCNENVIESECFNNLCKKCCNGFSCLIHRSIIVSNIKKEIIKYRKSIPDKKCYGCNKICGNNAYNKCYNCFNDLCAKCSELHCVDHICLDSKCSLCEHLRMTPGGIAYYCSKCYDIYPNDCGICRFNIKSESGPQLKCGKCKIHFCNSCSELKEYFPTCYRQHCIECKKGTCNNSRPIMLCAECFPSTTDGDLYDSSSDEN